MHILEMIPSIEVYTRNDLKSNFLRFLEVYVASVRIASWTLWRSGSCPQLGGMLLSLLISTCSEIPLGIVTYSYFHLSFIKSLVCPPSWH